MDVPTSSYKLQKNSRIEIKLRITFMVPDLLYQFQMIHWFAEMDFQLLSRNQMWDILTKMCKT